MKTLGRVGSLLLATLMTAMMPTLHGMNPIGPSDIFVCDFTARVFSDGKLYVYGSLDRIPGTYCTHEYGVLSTSDLKTWDWQPEVFVSKGAKDAFPYSDARLYAPDCIHSEGKYYV